ncbi:MAG: LysM peptidoglycan-binding domain-containing protein [Acidobacteria bacterium]|nr:MAG: LysM peptidoglycan-binding domain-containing protein [Acidobacteriota bacterium]
MIARRNDASASRRRRASSGAGPLGILAAGALLAAACATLPAPPPRDRTPEAAPTRAPVALEPPAVSAEEKEARLAEAASLVMLAREQARLGLLDEADQTWDDAIALLLPLAETDPVATRQIRAIEDERERVLEQARELEEAEEEPDPAAGIAEEILEGPEPAVDPEQAREVDDAARTIQPDYPVVVNDRVLAWLEVYTGPHRRFIAESLARSGRYIDRFREIFAEEGLPRDLVYMAIVESGFKTGAYSRAHARGIFQFISSTARRYGLRVDWWVDERADPERSCRAAAAYLRDLYDEFGDWYLALAAYNGGEGRVRRAVERAGTKDFWTLVRRHFFRRETRNYVPAILAATLIAKNPEKFGFGDVQYEPPLRTETVTVPTPTDLDVIARVIGTDTATLRRLNPALRRGQTPPGARDYPVRVPAGLAEGFAEKLAQVPPDQRIVRRLHRVRRGDTLSAIARRYGTTVRAIQQANGMGRRTLLRVGKILEIPRGPGAPPEPARAGADGIYRVRRGDTLSSIARRHGVSVRQLQAWNGLGRSTRIYAGQPLRVRPDAPQVARRTEHRSGSTSTVRGRVYRVRRGDTLWAISRRYGVSLTALMRANGLGRRSILRPGQTLRIPESPRVASATSPPQGKGTTHIVRRGDSLFRIARRYGVSVERLCALNDITPDTVIHPGDRLRIE